MKYPTNEEFQNRPPTVVPRGFMIFSSILIGLILVVGLITFFNLKTSLELPEDLKLYADRPSTMSQIASSKAAPADTMQLTEEHVDLFMGTLAPVSSGYAYMKHRLDSLNRREGATDKKRVDFWGSPFFIQQMNRMPLAARKDLVAYLNRHKPSWDEYLWLKEHVVAASGITRRDFDSLFDNRLRPYFRVEDSVSTNMIPAGAVPLFERAELLRRTAIDSTEIALVAPHRQRLLDSGFASLMSIEVRFAEQPAQ
jgi:hypothetical protein